MRTCLGVNSSLNSPFLPLAPRTDPAGVGSYRINVNWHKCSVTVFREQLAEGLAAEKARLKEATIITFVRTLFSHNLLFIILHSLRILV